MESNIILIYGTNNNEMIVLICSLTSTVSAPQSKNRTNVNETIGDVVVVVVVGIAAAAAVVVAFVHIRFTHLSNYL